ncbi:MAG TPA: outer membrane beta-barrel protein [Bacteroidota bacterium]
MKRFLRPALIILFLIAPANAARTQSVRPPTLGLYVQSGYFIPTDEILRTNYSQGFLLGSARVPLTLNIGIEYPYSPTIDITGEFNIKGSRLTADKTTSLSTTSLLIGMRYLIPKRTLNISPFQPFIGGGVGIVIGKVAATFTERDVNGNVITQSLEDSNTSLGYGIHLHAGVEYALQRSLLLGGVLLYDLNTLGGVEEGGLGNLGGLLAAIRVTLLI